MVQRHMDETDQRSGRRNLASNRLRRCRMDNHRNSRGQFDHGLRPVVRFDQPGLRQMHVGPMPGGRMYDQYRVAPEIGGCFSKMGGEDLAASEIGMQLDLDKQRRAHASPFAINASLWAI